MSTFTASGPLPAVSKGTHVIVPLVEDLEDDRWEATIVQQDDKRIKLSVNSLPTAVIGQYQLTVETNCPNGQAISKHDPANDILMLFNPWCEGKHGVKYVINYMGTMAAVSLKGLKITYNSVNVKCVDCTMFVLNGKTL